jgi:hypothetical protein
MRRFPGGYKQTSGKSYVAAGKTDGLRRRLISSEEEWWLKKGDRNEPKEGRAAQVRLLAAVLLSVRVRQ